MKIINFKFTVRELEDLSFLYDGFTLKNKNQSIFNQLGLTDRYENYYEDLNKFGRLVYEKYTRLIRTFNEDNVLGFVEFDMIKGEDF